MSDPYDVTKSWSVNVDKDDGICEGGQCPNADAAVAASPERQAQKAETLETNAQMINPLYPYDNCLFTEEGAISINGKHTDVMIHECVVDICQNEAALPALPLIVCLQARGTVILR